MIQYLNLCLRLCFLWFLLCTGISVSGTLHTFSFKSVASSFALSGHTIQNKWMVSFTDFWAGPRPDLKFFWQLYSIAKLGIVQLHSFHLLCWTCQEAISRSALIAKFHLDKHDFLCLVCITSLDIYSLPAFTRQCYDFQPHPFCTVGRMKSEIFLPPLLTAYQTLVLHFWIFVSSMFYWVYFTGPCICSEYLAFFFYKAFVSR